MSTSNINVTTTGWTKAADASDSDFLITWGDSRTLEVSTTETDTEPTIRGHRFHRETRVTREMIGAGFVWVKAVTSGVNTPFTVVITKTGSSSGSVGGYDFAEQVQKVAVLKWNTDALAWERSTTDGSAPVGGTPNPSKRFDIGTSAIYVGEAPPGTTDSSPVWLIKKIVINPSGAVTHALWATGAWDNHTALTYQ